MTRSTALHRLARLGVLMLALASGLSGCTNFLYDRLDTLAAWRVQELVSLDDDQLDDLKAWLKSTLAWHRQSELHRYAQFLRELASRSAHPGTVATYKKTEAQIDEFSDRVVAHTAPDIARLLMRLTPAQLAELDANLAAKAKERNKASLDAVADGKWHDKRARALEKQIKRWTGSITKEQQQLLARQISRFDSTAADWLESQAHWRKAMLGALQERLVAGQSPQANEERILALLRKPESQWTPTYLSKSTRNREQTWAVLESIDASLTASQRAHLQRELTELAQQLETMIES